MSRSLHRRLGVGFIVVLIAAGWFFTGVTVIRYLDAPRLRNDSSAPAGFTAPGPVARDGRPLGPGDR